MKVTVLIENTSDNSFLQCEHGLSFLIESDGKKILLDAGSTGAFIDNARKMKVNLDDVDFAVLSHGHYDHSGGFGKYLCDNKDVKLYAMKDATDSYYSGSGGDIHYIGLGEDLFPKHSERFVYIDKISQLTEGVYLIPHATNNLSEIGKRSKLYKMVDGRYEADDFSHEMSLVMDSEDGLVIFNSCSHGGLINIIEEVKKAIPNKKIYAYFGGLHMKCTVNGVEGCAFSKEEIKDIADYILREGIQKIYTGHCTGSVGYEMLKEHLEEKIIKITTGYKAALSESD